MPPRYWKIVSAIALSCCFTPVAAEAGPEEDNALAAFEAACLDNINDPSRAMRMAVAAGLKEVPSLNDRLSWTISRGVLGSTLQRVRGSFSN